MNEEEKRIESRNIYETWRKLLPDARLTAKGRRVVRSPMGLLEECYCVNCGVAGGFVTQDAVEHIFYLCDDCVLKHGHLPMPQVPEELIRDSNMTEI